MELKIKIVADSSCDLTQLENIDFEVAPLKIITSKNEYVDDSNLDVELMVNDLAEYKGKSSSSCPNMTDWLAAFGDADIIFCVTITATLSGSYNAACLAKESYEEAHPERHVFVLNSLTAGPEIALFIEKMRELALKGESFEDVCQKINDYTQNTGLLFMLESMKNLANNGRVCPITAKMAGILGIRVVGKASDKGDLEPLNKCRGEKKALETIVSHLKDMGLQNGKVIIAHCLNQNAANQLKSLILSSLPNVQIRIHTCKGLCSFYAEKGGMLIGFEKF